MRKANVRAWRLRRGISQLVLVVLGLCILRLDLVLRSLAMDLSYRLFCSECCIRRAFPLMRQRIAFHEVACGPV